MKHPLHLLLIRIAYGSRSKEIDKTFLLGELLILEDIFVDGYKCRIESGSTDLGLKSFAVNGNDQSIGILRLKFCADGIDVISDYSGSTGSKYECKLGAVSLHSLIYGFPELLLSSEYDILLIYVSYNKPRVLNVPDAAVDLTYTIHIDCHYGAAYASLRRMGYKY